MRGWCADPKRLQAICDWLSAEKIDASLTRTGRFAGQPDKITVIFGRKVTKQYRGKLQTVIEDMHLPNPVIRSHYGNGFVKQYVRDHVLFRTEPASNKVNDYGCKKAVEHLPQLRQKMSSVIDNYHNIRGTHASAERKTHSRPEAGHRRSEHLPDIGDLC
jgi:hypothetical protein